jgi:hypothetical protein
MRVTCPAHLFSVDLLNLILFSEETIYEAH